MCSNSCSKSSPNSWCGSYKEDNDGYLLRCAEFTKLGEVCVDECGSDDNDGYTWCFTNAYYVVNKKNWEYCSVPGYTVNMEPCTDQCETQGYSYYWCHTEKSWDYCSPPGRVVPVQHTYQGAL